MNCPSCRTACPATASFCPSCGYALDKETPPQPTKWETAEIVCETIVKPAGFLFGNALVKFTVKATGPKGLYVAAASGEIPLQRDNYLLGIRFSPYHFIPDASNAVQAQVNSLIQKLTNDGWESTGRPSMATWFGFRFRRPVK